VSSEADGDARESTDGGYVHVPSEGGGSDGADPAVFRCPEPEADGFGRKGWALTAVLFTCVLVIPGIIYVYPYAAGALGFVFATYLALPLIPAVLLGAVAVWSMMTAATRDQ